MADGDGVASSNEAKKTWHWHCCSKFCINSWRSQQFGYYTLTAIEKSPKNVRDAYEKIIGKPKINWKRHVICSAHWSRGERKTLEDLPDVKFTSSSDKNQALSPTWHWNCAATLCNNSWRTPGIHYYRLSEIEHADKELKCAYDKVMRNKNVNWKRHVLCSEHWSKGRRNSVDDKPDKSTSKSYTEQKKSFITPPRKLEAAKRCIENEEAREVKRTRRELIKVVDVNPKDEVIESLSQENFILRAEILEVKQKLKEREDELSKCASELTSLQNDHAKIKQQLTLFQADYMKTKFTYEQVIRNGKCFYMTGLTDKEFDCLFECIEPFLNIIVYPDCKSTDNSSRKLDHRTELMCFLTICRHALHLGVMGWMTCTSASTQSRLFVAWAIFLSTIFESIDLTPLPGELKAFLPKDFLDAGFADTSCLGDCTETRITASENFDINTITFSQYKNHTTGKTSVWITPHGALVKCSDTYPGTISDTDMTEQCGVLNGLERGTTVLTDKGFGITELCLSKGLHHNRPPLKYTPQYEESDISANFDIATLRIYNENYIGRMRDWAIMNVCWPANRIDIMGYVHKVLAHLVNILKRPIGPNEFEGESHSMLAGDAVPTFMI